MASNTILYGKDAQGNPVYESSTYGGAVNPSQAITSAALQPQANITLPNPLPPTDYSGVVTTGNTVIQANTTPRYDPVSGDPTDYGKSLGLGAKADTTGGNNYKALFDQYLGSVPTPPSSSDQYNQDYAASGIDAKQNAYNTSKQKFDAINAQIQGLSAAAQGASLQQEGRQAPTFAISGAQAESNRQYAIKAIPLQIQALAAQAEMTGNQNILQQAQDHLDTLFSIHSADAKAQYEYKTALADSVYNFATAQEKNRLDELKTKQSQDFTAQQNAMNQAQTLANTAITNGQGDIAGKILALDPKSPTYAKDVATFAGQITQKKDLQFVSGTATQPAGYFDKSTGKFTATGGGGYNLPTTPGQYVPGANPTVDAWAERIYNNQAKITEIPASDKGLRNAVTVALQALGNSLSGGPTVTELGVAAKNTAQDLLNKFDAGQGTSAVGKSGILASFGYGFIPGTARANFVTDFNTLKSQLSLDAVKYLKGQGQVSDAERALLSAAVTKLNLSQSEGEFRTTLKGIIDTLNGEKTPANTATIVTAPDGTQVQITD